MFKGKLSAFRRRRLSFRVRTNYNGKLWLWNYDNWADIWTKLETNLNFKYKCQRRIGWYFSLHRKINVWQSHSNIFELMKWKKSLLMCELEKRFLITCVWLWTWITYQHYDMEGLPPEESCIRAYDLWTLFAFKISLMCRGKERIWVPSIQVEQALILFVLIKLI